MIKIYGALWCPDCKRTKSFFSEQNIPFQWIDVDKDKFAFEYLKTVENGGQSIPLVEFEDGTNLIEPDNTQLAKKLNLSINPQQTFYDLVIIGGGPAGLTSAIYAARENLKTIVIEKSGLGGQAQVTERLDNYPGFPDGIKGGELAERFVEHARKNGVELLPGLEVVHVESTKSDLNFELSNGTSISSHAGIVATGSTYRRLNVDGEEKLIGAGIHFCSTCDGPFYKGSKLLAVIGGGNSAAEESLFLTQFSEKIIILQNLGELTASSLLVNKVKENPKIEVRTNVEIVEFKGDTRLESITFKDTSKATDDKSHDSLETIEPEGAFIFVGLTPNAGFLRGVELDDYGFIVADRTWQTTIPGLFVAGDVRSGATKQLASAVGEGATALLNVRRFLDAHSDTHSKT